MRLILALLFLSFVALGCDDASDARAVLHVSISTTLENAPEDGRLLLILADNDAQEPRFQVSAGHSAQPIFGKNVEGMKPGSSKTFDATVFGFPYASLADLPPGDYWVQGLLHVYETFNLWTGHTVKLPMDNGEGQQWNLSPGNLYSKPVKITIPEKGRVSIDIVLDQVIPPITEPEDTQWIKHIQFKSEKLSAFWGRDMYLGAHVLLPKGFDEHPEARYPLMVFHGHFPSDFGASELRPRTRNSNPTIPIALSCPGTTRSSSRRPTTFTSAGTTPNSPGS